MWERHQASGRTGQGLLTGTGLTRPIGMASTVAHDSHNLLILGNRPHLMAQAARAVAQVQGGVALFTEGGSIVHPLPIAGLISDEDWREVARRSREVGRLLQEAGCHLPYPFMTFSLLALVVIAELRLSDRGLIRIGEKGFEKVDLWSFSRP